MDIEEWTAKWDRLRREREALKGSYADLLAGHDTLLARAEDNISLLTSRISSAV